MSDKKTNIWKHLSFVCILALTAIAAVIAMLLIMGRPVWVGIAIYWVVLTLKKSIDLMTAGRENDEQ